MVRVYLVFMWLLLFFYIVYISICFQYIMVCQVLIWSLQQVQNRFDELSLRSEDYFLDFLANLVNSHTVWNLLGSMRDFFLICHFQTSFRITSTLIGAVNSVML